MQRVKGSEDDTHTISHSAIPIADTVIAIPFIRSIFIQMGIAGLTREEERESWRLKREDSSAGVCGEGGF